MTARKRAFTLIELLVVISIIGLLVALLLPALSGARKTSRRAVCLTHLRQLSHGWHMYADDNNDIALPGRFFKAAGGTSNPANWYEIGNGLKYRPRWVATMGKYVGLFAFDAPSTSDDRQDYDSKVYQCPTVPAWIDERNYAYGYNHQYLGNARKTNGRFHNFPVNRSTIASFAGTVLAGDCMGTAAGVPAAAREPYQNDVNGSAQLGNHGWVLDPPRLTPASDRGTGDAGSPRTAVDPRHLNTANVIFCDGHGESVTPEAIGYRRTADGTYADDGTGPDRPYNTFFSGHERDLDPPDRPT